MSLRTKLPRGFKSVGIFLFLGFVMASLAGTALLWPGTPLDGMWALNASAFKQLVPFGRAIGVPFLVGSGWPSLLRGWDGSDSERWGWKLAVAIIAIQIAGDISKHAPNGRRIRRLFCCGSRCCGSRCCCKTSSPVRAVFAKSRIQISR